MGLVREQIIGRTLGATRQADLYFASFTLPDFLNYLLAAGALSIVFIPIFVEYVERGEHDGAWRALSAIANFILVVGGTAIALLMFFARPLAGFVAPGFTGVGELETLTHLIRIILPAQFFLVVGGLLSAALQAQDRHLLPAMAPLIYSAGIIAGGLIGSHFGQSADGFAWGVLIGAAFGPFALPLCGCICCNMRWHPVFSFANPDLKKYLWLSIPIMIGFSIVVVDEWIVKNQASYLPPGALSYLQYGRTLMKVPIGVFGMAIGVASYPTISRMVAAGSVVEAYGTLAHAVRLMLFVTFAAQVCLTLAGFEAAYLIWGFLSHRFSTADAEAAGSVLAFLCLGLAVGRTNRHQPRLLCARKHLAAHRCRHRRRTLRCTALYSAPPAVRRDRSGDREHNRDPYLCAVIGLVAVPPVQPRSRGQSGQRRSRPRHARPRAAHGVRMRCDRGRAVDPLSSSTISLAN